MLNVIFFLLIIYDYINYFNLQFNEKIVPIEMSIIVLLKYLICVVGDDIYSYYTYSVILMISDIYCYNK